MRQSISAGFILLLYWSVTEKKYIYASAICIIAILFHKTSIFIIPVVIVGVAFDKINKKSTKIIVGLVSFAVAVLMVLIIASPSTLSSLLGRYDFGRKYIQILNSLLDSRKSVYRELSIHSYIELMYRTLFTGIALFMTKRLQCKDFRGSLVLYTSIAYAIYALFFFVFHSGYGYRGTWQLEFFLIYLLPLSCKPIKKLRTSKNTMLLYFSLVSCLFVGYCWLGWHGVIPLYFEV